jgi:dolichyl-diphosphooligosaccharide--protein glycosyltransferase
MARSGKGKKKGIKEKAKTQAVPTKAVQPAIADNVLAETVTHVSTSDQGQPTTGAQAAAGQQAALAEPVKTASIVDRMITFAKSGFSIYTIVLLALMGFMFYLRAVPTHDAVFTSWAGNYVNVAADDGVYHMRLLFNTISHYPFRIMYDPFTHFPYGSPIHFGPLFEIIPATIAIILGLGSPSTQLVSTVAAYYPTVLGALCIIPTYYIGKKLFGKGAGVLAAIILACLPGTFFFRSILGEYDHHVAEVLFMACTIACMVYALHEARKSGITIGQIKNKDWGATRATLFYGALTGLFFGCYLLNWVGALLMGLVFIVYFTIQAIVDHMQGKSLDYLPIMATLTFGIPALMVLPYSLTNLSFELAAYSPVQPIVLALGIVGVGIIYVLSQVLDRNKAEKILFPVTLAGVAIIGALLVYLLLPSLFGSVAWGLNVFHPIGGELSVEEVMPTYIDTTTGSISAGPLWRNFYFASPVFAFILTPSGIPLISDIFPVIPLIFTFTGAAMIWLLYRVITRNRPGEMLFLVWNLIMLLALISQNRFIYYFAVNSALLMGYLLYEVLNTLDFEKLKQNFTRKVKSYEDFTRFASKNLGGCISVALVIAIFLLMAVYPALPLSDSTGANKEGVLFQTANSGGVGMSHEWYEALTWMKNNTPDPQGSTIQANFDYLSGTYSAPASGVRYDYPSSAYGVMSWWDYGHMIEYVAQRAPNANPFQAGIIEENNTAGPSYFFTSLNETSAYDNLNKLGSRYVVIDNLMATVKFWAIQEWIGDKDGWFDSGTVDLGNNRGTVTLGFDSGKFYNSTMYKLYYGDADGMSHFRLVHDSAGDYVISLGYANVQTQYYTNYYTRPVTNYTEAEALYESGKQPVWLNSDVRNELVWGARPPEKNVKVFEKVLGATLTGSAPDGVQVNASVTLQSGDRQFTYTNSAVAHNGSYSITVPYPTEAMKGTDYSYDVVPVSKYTVVYGDTTKTVDVPETSVMNGGTIQVS